MPPRLSWESPSRQESLNKEGLYERGAKKQEVTGWRALGADERDGEQET